MSLLSLVNCETKRKYTLPYCTNEVIETYKLTDPGHCQTGENSTKTINGIVLYKPFDRFITLPATACRQRLEIYTCVYFFFGAKTCTLVRTLYRPTDRRTCTLAYQRHYTADGSLLPENDQKMATQNRLRPSYTWPTSKSIEVINFEMVSMTISKDVVENEYHHIQMGRLKCNVRLHTCTAGSWRLNYIDPVGKSCANRPKVKNATLTLHQTSRGFLFEVKEANLITTAISRCAPNAEACLKKRKGTKFLCTLSGHVLEIPETSKIVTTNATEIKIPATLRTIQQALVTVAHSSVLNAHLLEKYIKELTCESARASVVALMGSQRLNPSEVLSLILEKTVQAVYSAGTLRQLRCTDVQAVLQPTLKYKGHVANRPLFRAYLGNEAILTSLRQGRYLSSRITSTITSTKRRSFAFNNTVLIFVNNTLTDAQPALKRVSIKNIEIEENLYDLNEENLNEDLVEVAGSEEDITRQQLKNLILLTKEEYATKGVNIDTLLSETHNIDRELFAGLLEKAKSAFWPDATRILTYIGYCYTILGSVFLVIVIIQSCREVTIKKCTNKGK